MATYYQRNKERMCAYQREHYHSKRDYYREYQRDYYQSVLKIKRQEMRDRVKAKIAAAVPRVPDEVVKPPRKRRQLFVPKPRPSHPIVSASPGIFLDWNKL